MKRIPAILFLVFLALLFPQCVTSPRALSWESTIGPVPDTPITASQMREDVDIRAGFIPDGRYGRRYNRPMKPRYITIHSTQNPTGDAWAHAKALQNGRLRGGITGYLFWHFTVQDDVTVQHLPTNQKGEHADFEGPGNMQSIGIEMCEHRGNDLARTIDRTARLTALLMYYEDIPLENVVPHYHWPRNRYKNPHKDCPHFLLDDGEPKQTWRWFVNRVDAHYQRILAGERLARKNQTNHLPASRATPAPVWHNRPVAAIPLR